MKYAWDMKVKVYENVPNRGMRIYKGCREENHGGWIRCFGDKNVLMWKYPVGTIVSQTMVWDSLSESQDKFTWAHIYFNMHFTF